MKKILWFAICSFLILGLVSGCGKENLDEGNSSNNSSSENVLARSFKIGDKIIYNNMDFYVIEDSDTNKSYVTLLKSEPLTVDEVNEFGKRPVNQYHMLLDGVLATAYDMSGYGGIAFYQGESCNSKNNTDCSSNYDESEIKYVVENWAKEKLEASDLEIDDLNYKVRLITVQELENNLGFNSNVASSNTPSWVVGKNYKYWTMSSANQNNLDSVFFIMNTGTLNSTTPVWSAIDTTIRPVINLSKSAIK